MADDQMLMDQDTLHDDAQFGDMLERVSYAPGMMVGVGAMSSEQRYHVRRLTRHQRWLIGPGTVFGLRVTAASVTLADGSTDIRLTVDPGYAIDGLGREVLLLESYAVSLTQWIAAFASNPEVARAYDGTAKMLYLTVTIRAKPVPVSLQPVASELFDSGIDPVAPSRVGDGVLLELHGDDAKLGDAPASAWATWDPARTAPAAADLPGDVTSREASTIAQATDAASASLLRSQSWLLRRTLPQYDASPGGDAAMAAQARLLLASLHVAIPTLGSAPALADAMLNNLVRPFVRPQALLAPIPTP